jgi:hypothetical protein
MKRLDSISIASFKRWLKKQHPNARYKTCDSHSCPLAAYTGLTVGAIAIWNPTTPDWVRLFTRRVDKLGTQRQCVSPKKALAILEQVA